MNEEFKGLLKLDGEGMVFAKYAAREEENGVEGMDGGYTPEI